jgi:hypothetical protein
MLDSICEAKEMSLNLNSINPHIYSIATLTGHVVVSYGSKYSVKMNLLS